MTTKICKECKKDLPLEEYYASKRQRLGVRSKCKSCMNTYRKERYNSVTKQEERDASDAWRNRNREKARAYCTKWREKNKPRKAEQERIRKAKESLAKPAWLSKEQKDKILWYYAVAQEIRKSGIPCEVDHIIPLQGKNVCGLHVPWNLQILTKEENAKKHNSFTS